jgi:hypothetical protein
LDHERNAGVLPSEFRLSSGKRVWWKCAHGHSWKQRVVDRTGRTRSGCPVCWEIKRGVSEDVAVARFYDLSLLESKPELLSSWASSKNGSDVRPEELSVRDKTLFWWACPRNHLFQQSVFRMASGYKCPACSRLEAAENTRLIKLRNRGSLADRYPEVAALWHPTANTDVTPAHLGIGSHRMVWWQCVKGHDFQQSPNYLVTLHRRGSHSLCPVCFVKNLKHAP